MGEKYNDSFDGRAAILAETSDFLVVFDDGSEVPCCRFLLTTSCGVFRRILGEGLESRRLKLRGAEPATVKPALHFLHGLVSVTTLGVDDVLRVRLGLDYLDCPIFNDILLQRTWDLVKLAPLEALLPHAPDLFQSVLLRQPALARMADLAPDFKTLRETVVKVLDACPWGSVRKAELACWLADKLHVFYPPVPLFNALLPYVVDAPKLFMSIAGEYTHPMELEDLAKALARDCEMLDKIHKATTDYYPAPLLAAQSVHGSSVSFEKTPLASACLAVAKPTNRRRVAKWLSVSVQRASGLVDLEIVPRYLDAPCRLDVRIVATSDLGIGETWGIWSSPLVLPRYRLSEAPRCVGSIATVARGRNLRLRIDVFYGGVCAYDQPSAYLEKN